jgi:hypothetical protein
MPVVTPQQAILIGLVVAPVIFALCAYFTHASLRRTLGGLMGAIAYCLAQYAWDRFAALAGWWSYPGYEPSTVWPMPPAIYIFSGLVFGGFGLVGWRITCRFGWKGLVIFLAAWGLWGFTLDHSGSSLFSSSRLMVIGAGAAAGIADFLVYVSCMAAVLLAIRVIGGPFRVE